MRSQHAWPIIVACLLVAVLDTAVAQLPTSQGMPGAADSAAVDSTPAEPFRIRPPVSPLGVMWRSLVLPGWGQSILHRRQTGAFFVAFEGLALGMTLKSRHQLRYLEAIADENDAESVKEMVDLKRQEVQDWAVVMAFNHLMAAAEAYVSAYLWDFPANLTSVTLENGRLGVGVRVGLP